MDDELRRIFSISSIGGLFGWVNAKLEVDEFCVIDDGTTYSWSEYENQCVGEGGWLVKNMAIDLVYPSSILTGLVIGFFLGVIYANLRSDFDAWNASRHAWNASRPKKKKRKRNFRLRRIFTPKAQLQEKKAPPPPKSENFVCDCGFNDPNSQVMIEHRKMCKWSKSGAGLESH